MHAVTGLMGVTVTRTDGSIHGLHGILYRSEECQRVPPCTAITELAIPLMMVVVDGWMCLFNDGMRLTACSLTAADLPAGVTVIHRLPHI